MLMVFSEPDPIALNVIHMISLDFSGRRRLVLCFADEVTEAYRREAMKALCPMANGSPKSRMNLNLGFCDSVNKTSPFFMPLDLPVLALAGHLWRMP